MVLSLDYLVWEKAAMPAPLRLQYDAIYHIWNRGVDRSVIFQDEDNYRHFLGLVIRHIEPVARTCAYCLMPNHFHFLVRTRTEEEQLALRQKEARYLPVLVAPSQAFSNLCNAYVRAFNRRYGRTGGLFEDRFGRRLVTDPDYLVKLIVYIHQNPVRHGFVDDIREWRYSSYAAIERDAPSRVWKDEVLSIFGGHRSFVEAHQQTSEVSFSPDL